MIAAQPDTLTGTHIRALFSVSYDFLTQRSELVAIQIDGLKFTPDGALKGMIRNSKPTNTGWVGLCSAPRGVQSSSGSD